MLSSRPMESLMCAQIRILTRRTENGHLRLNTSPGNANKQPLAFTAVQHEDRSSTTCSRFLSLLFYLITLANPGHLDGKIGRNQVLRFA